MNNELIVVILFKPPAAKWKALTARWQFGSERSGMWGPNNILPLRDKNKNNNQKTNCWQSDCTCSYTTITANLTTMLCKNQPKAVYLVRFSTKANQQYCRNNSKWEKRWFPIPIVIIVLQYFDIICHHPTSTIAPEQSMLLWFLYSLYLSLRVTFNAKLVTVSRVQCCNYMISIFSLYTRKEPHLTKWNYSACNCVMFGVVVLYYYYICMHERLQESLTLVTQCRCLQQHLFCSCSVEVAMIADCNYINLAAR